MREALARLQDELARLVTDAEASRALVGEVVGGLSAPDVVRYARGLRRKRWDDVEATVPLSARVVAGLGARYEAWLGRHPARANADGLPPGPAEALRALPPLTRALAADPGEAPWAAELLTFEVLGACSRADGAPRGFVARHAIHEIAAELRAGLIPVDPPAAPHRYAFDGAGVRWRAAP
jgi:hypothetical protein